uniref:RING-type domain-containing protein n=1 Tax=Panagrolaimus superbus TaxID=310955 RepID=A0A914ZDD6_9BILA
MVLPLLFDHCVEEEKIRSLGCSYKQWSYSMLKPGHCPECHLRFKEPVALSCGHSICQVCCDALLEKCNRDTVAGKKESRRQTIRMGMSSFAHPISKRRKSVKLQKSLSIIQESDLSFPKSSTSERSIGYLSPQCPACLAPPRFQAPIKNFALEKLIEAWERYKSTKGRSSAQSRKLPSPAPSSTSSSGFDEAEDHYQNAVSDVPVVDFSIKKCNIAVLGAAGVGKSRIVRTQHLNNLFFGKIGSDNEINGDSSNSITELQAKYMIEILDNNDLDGDLEDADAIILAYSCNNHDSFVTAFKIFEQIKQRGMSHVPLILVATKCDIDAHRRTVKQEEAESLARHIGCQHMEISARKNIGVNEVFAEIVKQIENNSEETLEAL